MDKDKSTEVSIQDNKQDESSSGCGSEKTGEIILPKEKEGLNLGSSFGGSAGGITIKKVAADGVIKITEQKEHLQSDDELMVNAATATKVQDKEDGSDTTTSSSEITSLTLPGEVLESKGEGTKSSDPNLFSYLGLVKNGAGGMQSQTTASELSPSVPNNPGGEEQYGQKGKFSTDSPGQSSNLSSRQTAKPVKGDPVKVTMFSGSKDRSQPVDQIPGGSGGNGEDQSTNQTSSTPPRFIKLNLDQSKETIICCPLALLLQHKDYVDVTLQEDHKDMYSIKCCKCFHEDSEPYAMLEHLYEAHQIQGDLNRLLNLNSQHLGCMSHPECVNIPGVPTLPEGLSDLDNGVIRFNSMGIPRRSFACRLCPLNFTTSRGLLAHHQYFTRSVLSKEGKDPCYSTFLCKVCPRQFANFLDFYAHHKWMRVNKDFFAKEKKVNIMNSSGEIVASVSATMRSNEKTSSTTKFIWGFEANLTPEKNVQGYSIQSFPKTVSGPTDSCADVNELKTGTDHAKNLSEIQYVESSISYLPGKQEKEEPKFGCGICLKTFPRLVQLQGHMGSHAKKQNPISTTTYIVPAVEEPKDIEYKCGICSEIFTKLSMLQNHMEGHCKPLKQKRLPVASPFQTDTGSFSETVTLISYACDICNRTFLSEVKLWDHRLTHGPEAANKNTVLPSKKTDINRKKNHTCSVCKRSYYHKKSLNFHETKGPCKMKVPVFVALQNAIQPIKKLEKHTRAAGETKDKVVTRRKDGVKNASRSRLKGQAGKKKEVQSQDGQEFSPPHDCDGCDKTFNLLWQLQRHKGLRTKANKYQIQHGAEMTGTVIPKPPYSCNVCHQRFTCFWQLKCHKGKRHGQLSKWLALSGVKSLTIKMQTLSESAGSSQEVSGVSNNNTCDNATDRKSAKVNRLQRLLAACRRSKVKCYNTRAQKKKIQSKEPATTNISTILQYKCNICSKSFARKASLRSHKISHNRKMKNKSQEAVSQLTDESGKQMSAAETSEVCDDKRQESSCAPQRCEDSCSEKDSVAIAIDDKHDKSDCNVTAVTEIEQETLPIVPDLEMDKSLQKASEETTCNEMDLQSAVTKTEQETLMIVPDLEMDKSLKKASEETICNEMDLQSAATKTEQETLTIVPDLEMDKSLQNDLQSSTDNSNPNSPEANESHMNKSGDSEKDQSHKAELESSKKIPSDEQEPQTSLENIPSENNKTVSSGEVLNGEIDSQPLRQIVRDLIKHQFSSKNPSQNYILEKQHLAIVSSPKTMETSQDEISSSSILGNVLLNKNPVEAVNSQNSLSNTLNEEMKERPENTTDVEDLSSVEVTPDKNNLQLSGENKTDFVSTGKDASDEPDIKPSEELHSDEMDSPSSENNLSEGASTHPLEQGLSDNSGEKTLHTYVSDMTEPPTMEIETSDKNGPHGLGITGTSVEIPLENPYVVVETVVDDSELETETDFLGNEPNYHKIPQSNNSNNQCVEGSSNNADSKPAEEGVNVNPSTVSSETSNIIAIDGQSSIESITTMTNPTFVQNLQNDETVNQALTEGSEASIQTEFVRTETETSKMFTCKVCSKTYAKFNQLNAHKRCHERKRRKKRSHKPKANLQKKTGAAKFTCDLCGVSFSEYRSLNGHKGAHASHKNSTGFKNRPTTKLESSKEIQSHAVDAEDTIRPTTELESSLEIQSHAVDAEDTNRPTTKLETSKEIQSHAVDAEDTNPQVQSLIDISSDGIAQNSHKHQEESQQKSKSLVTSHSADCLASVQEIELQKAASKVAMDTSSSLRKLGKYSCEQCSKTFSRFTQLKCHMISHTAKQLVAKPEKPYFCKICKLKFLTATRFLIHMKRHGSEKECELLRQKMALQDTDHSYYKKVLDESENRTASETNKMQQQQMEASKKNGNTTWSFVDFESPEYRVLSCPYCSKKYAKQCHLSNHMNVHKHYKCTLCGASFWTPRQLSCHFACHSESIKQNNDTKKAQESGVKPNTVPASLSEKPTDFIPPSGSVPLLACNQSSVILKKIFRVFLSGLRHKKKGAVYQRSKWFQPNRSLQRAAMKCHQARLQKILGALRKAIIMEIEADTHKVVYDCTECRKSSFCHKAILRHFLEKHLPQTEEKKEKPASPEIVEERPSGHQRFRNCPICKGSSGFQCHLHNTTEHIDLKLKSVRKKKTFSCDQCNQKFTQRNRLLKHKASHKVYKEDARIVCQFCEYTAISRFAMAAHLKIHKKRHSKYFKANSKGIMQLGARAKVVKTPHNDSRECYTCRTCGKFFHSVKAFRNHTLEHEVNGSLKAQHGNNSNPNENSSNPGSQHGSISNPSRQHFNTSSPILEKRGSRNLTLQHGKNNNATNTSNMQCGNGSNPTTVQREDNRTPNLQNGNSSTQHGDNTSPTVQHVDTGNPAKQNDVSSKHTLQKEENNMTRRKKRKHTLFKQPGLNLPFSCAQCTDAFKTPDRLWDHIIKEHTSKNAYSCTKCAFSTDSPFSLQRHQKKHPETSLNKQKWHTYLRDVLHSNLTPIAGLPNSPTKVRNGSHGSEKIQSDIVSPNKMGKPEVETKLGFTETVKSPRPEIQTMKTVPQLSTEYDTPQNSEGSTWMSVESPDEYFACSQCKDFRASTQKEWDQHIVMVHKGNNTDKFSCKMCQYTTTNKERLERHLKLHRRMTLQCDSCPYRTPQRHQMIRHVQTVHKQQKPFKCKTCSYSTAYNHHLRRHAEKHKNPNFRCRYRKFMKNGDWHKVDTNKGNAGVICNECGCELRNKKTLRRHQLKKHFRITGAAPPGSLGPSPDVQRSFSVIQPQSVNTGHTVFGEKLPEAYQCSICSMVFKRRCDLNQHVAKGHQKTGTSLPSQCPQCGLVTGSGQLEDHMKIHEEENLLSCNEEGCQFKTAELVHLQRHQTKHAAQREALNTCRPCQMTFPDPSSLEVHNHQHHSKLMYNISNKDPFLCSHCPYRSPCEKDANRHWKLHNYNLPFKCEYCVFSTSTAAAIATHRKIHSHGRRNSSTAYVSKKASKNRKMRSTGSKGSPQSGKIGMSSLPQHVFMSNQGKKLYECRYCQRFFEVAEAWQRHELRHMAEWPQY